MPDKEIAVGSLEEIEDPGCREFTIGDGDWPLSGFVIRQGDDVFAYQNVCAHVGHPLNWSPNTFLNAEKTAIVCMSHGAVFDIRSGNCIAGPGRGGALKPVDVCVREGHIYVSGPDNLRDPL